jgi:hypothetical protein
MQLSNGIKEMRQNLLTALCFSAVFTTSAIAHEVDLKGKARELGISVGHSYICTPEDKRALARADSEAIFDMILFEINHEHAYTYAVAVGYGAGMDKKDIDCDKTAASVAEVKSKMGLGGTK